jgi:hypothetical protein
MRRSYSTDLSDAEWEYLELHIPAPSKRGRPKTHSTREILNAIFYIPKERLRLAALALRVPTLENRWTEMVIMEVLEWRSVQQMIDVGIYVSKGKNHRGYAIAVFVKR